MKERVPKHLLLGRFPRRPLASLLGEGLEEGAARGGSEVGANEGTGGELTSLAAAESLGLVLESSNSSNWSRPRRSQSHDGSNARPSRNGGSGMDSVGEEATGSVAGSDASREQGRKRRSRSEAPCDDSRYDTFMGPLSIVGQKAKASGSKKLSAGTKQFLAAQLQEEKKKAQESGDAALGQLYFSFSSMKDAEGRKVVLKNREKVVRTLHDLNTMVAIPLSRHFGLRYNFFSEHHCQAKKAGVTVKDPLILRKQGPDGEIKEETRHLVTIRIRIRVHPTKGDPQTKFISRGTQLAVLLHEMCHLKHMNHGKDFMLFLRDMFAQATKLGIFDPAGGYANEIPSPWPWEQEIFRTGGAVGNEELLSLFMEHKAMKLEKARLAEAMGDETARKAAADEAAADLGLAREAAEVMAGKAREENDPLAAAIASRTASPELPPPASPDGVEALASDAEARKAILHELMKCAEALPPPAALSRHAQRKAFCASPGSVLNLASDFQKGLACADECCADIAGPSSVAVFYQDGDADVETSTEITSPSRRNRSHSRGSARSQSMGPGISRSSSVVKLPKLHSGGSATSPLTFPPHLDSPARGRLPSGVPPLPPIV